jgi:hypothetical protein
VGRSLATHLSDSRSIALPDSFGDEPGVHGRPSGVEDAAPHSCPKRRGEDAKSDAATHMNLIGSPRLPLRAAIVTRGAPPIGAEYRHPGHGSPFVH